MYSASKDINAIMHVKSIWKKYINQFIDKIMHVPSYRRQRAPFHRSIVSPSLASWQVFLFFFFLLLCPASSYTPLAKAYPDLVDIKKAHTYIHTPAPPYSVSPVKTYGLLFFIQPKKSRAP